MLEPRTLADVARLEGIACSPEGSLFACDDAGRSSRSIPTRPAATQIAAVDGWGMGSPATAPTTSTCAPPGPRPSSASTSSAATPGHLVHRRRRHALPAAQLPRVRARTGRCTCPTPGRRRRARWTAASWPCRRAAARRPSWPTGSTTQRPGAGAGRHAVRGRELRQRRASPRYSLADGSRRRSPTCRAPSPTGIALCDDGALLVCCFQPNRIYRIPPAAASRSWCSTTGAGCRR